MKARGTAGVPQKRGGYVTDKPKRKKAGKAPVSQHPAFPAIVGLWFAALLGIASLMVPISLFERMSEASGLSSLIAAAQPPLGATAHIAIALAAAGIGALVGLAVARRVVRANRVRPAGASGLAISQPAFAPAEERTIRPISAHEELGAGGFDLESQGDDQRDISDAFDTVDTDPALPFADDGGDRDFPQEGVSPEAEPDIAYEAAVDPALPLDREPFGNAGQAGADEPADPFPETAAEALSEPAEDDVESTDRSTEYSSPASPTSAEVSIVDLVDRFARALQKHRENVQARIAEDEVEPAAEQFDAPSDRALPAALRPLGSGDFADDGDDDETDDESIGAGYSSLLGMKSSFGLPREPVLVSDESEDDDTGDDETGMDQVVAFPGHGSRFASPVSADDSGDSVDEVGAFDTPPPFVAATPVPAETERALRDALERLQRISGAA